MSSGLIKFLKTIARELGEAALAAVVSKHVTEQRLSIQQQRDLADELAQVGLQGVAPRPLDDQAAHAIENEAKEPKHDAAQAAADEHRVAEPAGPRVAVVDSQGVVQKVVETQTSVPADVVPVSEKQ